MLFRSACHHVLRQAIRSVGLGPVLEPYVKMQVHVEEDSFGKLMQHLTDNGGEILGYSLPGASSDISQDTNEDDDILPYPEDGLYIPSHWISPSSITSDSSSDRVGLRRTIHVSAPLSKMLDFNTRLRALTGGRGSFSMLNARFKVASQDRKAEILKEIGKA